jgi:hypothetical protein
MKGPAMDEDNFEPLAPGAAVPTRNKGLALVDSFRLARAAARPAQRNEMQSRRASLQQQRLEQLGLAATPPAPAPRSIMQEPQPAPAATPETPQGASVFAAYCVTIDAPAPLPEALPPLPEELPSVLEAAPELPEAPPIARVDIPLSVIGFGPGMTIRLCQRGIENAADLAAAEAGWLQSALGDLSDLVHAERWIESAQQACDSAPKATP